MNNTTQIMPVNEIIALLANSYNVEVAEHDQLLDQLETANAEKDNLAITLKNYSESAATLLEKVEKSQQLLAQAHRERDQAVNANKDLKLQLHDFKAIANTPKKVREKIKGYQERLEKQKTAAEQHKRKYIDEKSKTAALRKEIGELTNRLDATGINQVYRSDNDIVQTYPYILGDMIKGYDPKQTPLLYLHQSGRGGLILLNKDNEAELVESPKGGIRIKKTTLEHCAQWLRRAKSNNWQLEREDIESLSHGSE